MNAIRYSVVLDVYISHCCLYLVTTSAIPPSIIYQTCCNMSPKSLNLEVYSSAKCTGLFSALRSLISDLRNICRRGHSKKLTILENSVDTMQEQIQKCSLKEAITSKLKSDLIRYNHGFELQKYFLFWSQ